MDIAVKVDTSALNAALEKFPKRTTRLLLSATGNEAVKVQREARHIHNFTTRSGQADRSIQVRKLRKRLGYMVWLNPVTAPYSRRLHEGGQGKPDRLGRRMTNRPDKFLKNAVIKLEASIRKNLNNAVSMAIRSLGL